MSITTSRFVP